jgi:hypothetical protein
VQIQVPVQVQAIVYNFVYELNCDDGKENSQGITSRYRSSKTRTQTLRSDPRHRIAQRVGVLLLRSIDLICVVNSEGEVIDLLSAFHRSDSAFIVRLVEQEYPMFVQRRWWKNVAPILKMIRRVDHARSPLFDQIQSSEWCTAEVEETILEIQGV